VSLTIRTPAHLLERARALGGVAVVGRNQGDWEASSAVGPLLKGRSPPVRDGPTAWPRSARALVVRALAGVMEIDETTLKLGISLEEVAAAIGYEARIVSQKAI